MKLHKLFALLSIVTVFVFLSGCSTSPEAVQGKTMTVYYSPTCSCCKHYIDYLRNNGINVKAIKRDQSRMSFVKKQHGIPDSARSCHTGLIGGYAVEGHVPVEAIAQLLNEQPETVGISIPGMPRNTPGMGQPLGKTFAVESIDQEGKTEPFTTVTY